MKYLIQYIQFTDWLNEKIGKGISWLTTILVLVVCYDVFTRYLLKESSVAVQELEWHFFAIIFFIAAAYTLNQDRHVRVDVFYQNFSERTKLYINLFGNILFLIPFSLLVIWASADFVSNSFIIMESSPDPGGLPFRFILKSIIPIGFFLILLQGVANTFRNFLSLFGDDELVRGNNG